MIHSLRFRLLLTLIFVVMVAVGTVALFASRVSASELQRYAELDMQRRNSLFQKVLAYYDQHPRPEDGQSMAVEMERELGERVIITDAAGLVLADSAQEQVGQVLQCDVSIAAVVVILGQPRCMRVAIKDHFTFAGSSQAIAGDLFVIGAPLDRPPNQPLAQFTAAVSPTSTLLQQSIALSAPRITIRWSQDVEFDPIKVGFISSVNRSLLLAVVAAGLAALLLTLALARRILGPVEALTAAARALEQGDLSRRVQVFSKDEIGTLAHAFNAMADGLERLEGLRRSMVSDVAHELRTPLTNIRGYLEALRDGVAEPGPR